MDDFTEIEEAEETEILVEDFADADEIEMLLDETADVELMEILVEDFAEVEEAEEMVMLLLLEEEVGSQPQHVPSQESIPQIPLQLVVYPSP